MFEYFSQEDLELNSQYTLHGFTVSGGKFDLRKSHFFSALSIVH